jgi:hypothetical protein
VASDQVTVQQVAADQLLGSEGIRTSSPASVKRELREVANKLAIRGFALKAVADGLEQQQKALEASSGASAKHLARVQRSAAAAIRRAQYASKKMNDSNKSGIAHAPPEIKLPPPLHPPTDLSPAPLAPPLHPPASAAPAASTLPHGTQEAASVPGAPQAAPAPGAPEAASDSGAPEAASASGAPDAAAVVPTVPEIKLPPQLDPPTGLSHPPLPPPLMFPLASAASASGAPELPATAPTQPPKRPLQAEPSPMRKLIGNGSIIQVATEHPDARAHHGAWGRVTAMLSDGIILFENQNASNTRQRMLRVPISWCCLVKGSGDGGADNSGAAKPTPPMPWKKNTSWLQKEQKATVREVWLPVPLAEEPPQMGTQLAESELAVGSCEILWRLRVQGAVVVPPWLTSFVARHITQDWAANDRHEEGHQLVCQLKEYAARAELLVLPFQSETHWTLLVVQRHRQLPSPSQQHEVKKAETAEGANEICCEKCKGGGCLHCNQTKAISHWNRVADEDRCLDPIKNLQPIAQPQPWTHVRYYDTLREPSEKCAALAVGILDALQTAGVNHHLRPDLLARERHNSRIQQGVSCGFWVLHYIEEELRRFRGEGRFSFCPDQAVRLALLNGFAERVR